MRATSRQTNILALVAALAVPAWGGLSAQQQDAAGAQPQITVTGTRPPALAELPKGPVLKGMISARKGDRVQITVAGGAKTIVTVTDETKIRSSGGFLGASTKQLGANELLNGLPVTVETAEWEGALVASKITLQNKDLKVASMIRNGTDQRFDEQTAATEALRSRVADIDNYNVKGVTNVNFDTGKYALSPQAKADLCNVAIQAQQTNNALLLVIGYTDSTGSQEFNQTLSEKRATGVVNYLQQACHWKPYRMLTPTGMAEADPAADNSTPEGKAQNRRVAVNIMVSKAVDGMSGNGM
jgi:outer membrane protein OmpA-like peptidoglycan-associated protein